MENILEVSTISIEAPAGPKCYKLCEKIKLFRNSRFVYNVKFLELKLWFQTNMHYVKYRR